MIRILVPLDGSTAAEEALKHALLIAQTFPAELHLLRVIGDTDAGSSVRRDSIDFALSKHQAQTYLSGVVKQYAADDKTIQCEVAEGSPAETLVRTMETTKPDLVALTRYGAGNAHDFAAGGTAQKVVSRSECSVLLLDPRRQIDCNQHYQRILVPIDDGKESDCAVAVAALIAETHHASLRLVHMAEVSQLPPSVPHTRHAQNLARDMSKLMRQEAERRLREVAARLPSQIPTQTDVLLTSNESLAIESTAEECDSDLLVLHTSNSCMEKNQHYDATNQALIMHSHRPLFILRAASGDGHISNFRSVYLDEPCLEAG